MPPIGDLPAIMNPIQSLFSYMGINPRKSMSFIKGLPMKYYILQRARVFATLLVVCMVVYIMARILFDTLN